MADLNSIYSRLNSGSQYTPLSAETFGDWSLEAGDVVTVKKNGAGYQTPVMCSSLKWNGAPMVTIESEGNTEREPLSKMSRRSYGSSYGGGGGYGGYYHSKKAYTRIDQTDEAIIAEAYKREENDNELRSFVQITADGVLIEANKKIAETGEKLTGQIKVEAGRISQIVESVGADGTVTAASIVASVNKAGSSVVITAEHIQLDGEVFAKKLKAAIANLDGIAAKIVETNSALVKTYLTVNGVINAYGGIQTSKGQVYNVGDAVPSGNNLVITYANGTHVNFSKAIARWAVNASGGTIRVTAQPQNQTKPVRVGISGPNTISRSGTYTYKVTYENDSGDDIETGASMNVNVSIQAEQHSSSTYLTYNYAETLGSGTVRYHYYTTNTPIHTSGSRAVWW